MLIKTFSSWEEAEEYAEKNNVNLGLYSIKNGQHETDYKFLYHIFKPIDLVEFYYFNLLTNCYVIELNEYEKSEIEFIDIALKNEEITQEEYDERLLNIKLMIEKAKKFDDDVIIQYPDGTEISDKRFQMKVKEDTTTYVIGAEL